MVRGGGDRARAWAKKLEAHARARGHGCWARWDAESLIFTASLRDGMPSSSISVVREMSG